MLIKRDNGKAYIVHTHEVRRNAAGFTVVTRHYSEGSAVIEARLNGGEVFKR